MKKVAGFAVILILAGFLTLYGDGLEGLFNISPFGGFAFPIGDMADGDLQNPRAIYRKSGYEFGISTEGFFEPGIGVGLNFRYAVFDSKELEGFSPDDKLQTINIGVHMKSVFFLESIVHPYASVGGGITFSKIKNKILEVDEQGDIVERGDAKLDDRFFVFGGAGVMYGITDMISVFGEIDINYLSNLMYLPTDSTNLPLPEEESDNFFIDLKFGLNFWFGG